MSNYQYVKKVSCPYCGSIQVKAMARQPNKYPKPQDPADLNDWQNGYDCKKCGSEFVISASQPKEEGGIFSGLLALVILAAALYGGYHFLFGGKDSHKKNETSQSEQTNVADQELKPLNNTSIATTEVTPEPQPIEQEEFTSQAEEAAHSYTPTQSDYQNVKQEEKPESISDSQNQNDTLSIKTTIRNKSE